MSITLPWIDFHIVYHHFSSHSFCGIERTVGFTPQNSAEEKPKFVKSLTVSQN